MTTKTASRTPGSRRKPSSAMRSTRRTIPATEREQQDRAGRERQRAHRRAGIELAESGEDQGEECRRERRPRARSRALQVRASRVGYRQPPKRAPRRPAVSARRPPTHQPTRRPSLSDPEAECSDPSNRSPTSSPRSTRSWMGGATVGRSLASAPRTPAVRDGASSTAPSPPTTRWASITPGAARTRTSTSASTRCSARTSATRTGSTARACGSRSTSSATSGSPRSATSRRSGSPSS